VAKKKRLFSQAEVEAQLVAGLYHVVDEADWPQLRLLGFDSSTKTLGGVLLDAGTGRLLAYFGFDWHSYYLADRIGMQQAMLERLLPRLTIGALWIGVGVELPASGDFRGAGALALMGSEDDQVEVVFGGEVGVVIVHYPCPFGNYDMGDVMSFR